MGSSETGRLVAVDIGNSAVKFAVFSNDSSGVLPVIHSTHSIPLDESDLSTISNFLSTEAHWWAISSVHDAGEKRLINWLAQARSQDDYRLLNDRDIRLTIYVDFPEKVGTDRLVAAVAIVQ